MVELRASTLEPGSENSLATCWFSLTPSLSLFTSVSPPTKQGQTAFLRELKEAVHIKCLIEVSCVYYYWFPGGGASPLSLDFNSVPLFYYSSFLRGKKWVLIAKVTKENADLPK